MGFMHLAIGQAPVVLGDVGKNLDIMENLIREAQKDYEPEIDLIAFPELFVTGYNLRDSYSEVAEKIPGEGKAQSGMCELAKKYNIHVATGIVEKAGKSLFNSAILVGPKGYIGHYRKQFLPNFGPFEEKMFFGQGDQTPVFDTPFGKIGMQICYDIFFPETSMGLAHNGADLILNLSASPTTSRPLFHRVLPARAIETTCFYGYANNIGTQGSLTFAGESVVVDPRGKTMAEIPSFEEGVLVCEIPIEELDSYRDSRPVLRDSKK
jgi:predicted amidohydrolase|tara:strand:+ start:43 stop:840 length:798 start_codon:yes stop_codon:yes gene_type:complete